MSTFSTPQIVALILLAVVVGYFALCGLGRLVDRRRDTDPRNGSV